ncbi:DUF2938 domain-containing protein [Aestuariispira ectoiniformans]|uniref:DUF2938 domain-containing protein n=1 Tax=Aestuariispira ectoiniformans TaxID=2775080 RepID=UPI00223B4A7C|nr:DUF2938 domain-containing protein [Aestuariispira ectoiniformans]
MTVEMEFVLRAVTIGVGATLVMDFWALGQKSFFNIPSLNYAMVGRWLGNMARGNFAHANIGAARPVAGEAVIGWSAHYIIGVVFAAVLLRLAGIDWALEPSFLPAFGFGLVTVVMPFFVMQPAFGFGIAASKTPAPNTARLRSLIAHGSFGLGLYLAALLASIVL